MKSTLIMGLAALSAVATAHNGAPWTNGSNGTHFVDPATNQTTKHFNCDVHQGKASAHFNSTIRTLHLNHQHSAVGTRAAKTTSPFPITVPLYIHVITKTAAAGSITQTMANNQVKAMNAAYNPYGVSFALQGTTFTANDAWAVASGNDMTALKQALRVGNYSTLNLYFHTDLAGGVLGTCTLPSQVYPGIPASAYVSDGCNIAAGTMPGGTLMGYNQGKTAVHETGHWLGLLHTFEGYSCTGAGDSISDTPMESVSTDGCPVKPAKDSCPSVAGVDPVHNYMDYSTDACYTRFTPGQVARIGALWTQYRKGN